MEGSSDKRLLGRLCLLGVILLGWALLLYHLDSVPPGLQHDETFNIFDVIDLLYGRYRIYFPSNYGREPLFFYTVAAIYRYTGLHFVWGLRFSGVLWAMIGLAFSIALAKRYLRLHYVVLSNFLMVTSFWFIFTSRVGLRAISLFPMTTGTCYFILRGFDKRRYMDFIMLGIVSGLSVYCYLPGRFIPVVVAVIVLIEYVIVRVSRNREYVPFSQVVTSILMMGLVSTPMYYYIFTHPDLANQRINELSGPINSLYKGDVRPVLVTVKDAFQTIFVENKDSLPFHYSLPHMPILLPPLSVLFAIGIIVVISEIRRIEHHILLAWLFIGLMPDMVTPGGPFFLRSIIALPIIFITIAIGASRLYRLTFYMHRASIRKRMRLIICGTLMIVAVWHAVYNIHGYYNVWAQADDTQVIYRSDLRRISAYLNARPSDARTFIASSFWLDLDQQTYLLYQPQKRDVGWFNARLGIPLPSGKEIFYIFTASSRPTPSLRCILNQAEKLDVVMMPSGKRSMFEVYRIEPWDKHHLPCDLRPTVHRIAFGGTLRLDSAVMHTDESQATVLTQWTVLAPWPHTAPPKLSVRLRDATGKTLAQVDDAFAVAYQHWRRGDKFLQVTRLSSKEPFPHNSKLFLVVYSMQGALTGMVDGRNVGEEVSIALK